MEDGDTTALESALEGALGNAPPPKPAPAPVRQEIKLVEDDADPVVAGDPDPADPPLLGEGDDPDPTPVTEPEFVIEVNGKEETVKGAAQIKELLQKGKVFSQGTEEVARVREQLIAQHAAQENARMFQEAAFQDIAQLKALDDRLAEFNRVDWNQAIDTDFVGVMKLQAQRQQLNELRQQKLNELNQKHQSFVQGQAQATQQRMAAEEAALVAKLPAWRNSEKGLAESKAIREWLGTQGYTAAEASQIPDHRHMLIARKAFLYDQARKGLTAKDKQLREAPPVVKPGAASAQSSPNAAIGFAKQVQTFKQQGRKGNIRAQETLLEGMLGRAFK